MPCKVLSFDEIHTTKDFFKDCNECVNLNYRKQLEQVEENALYQQLKVDQMYWKKRAMEEGTEELVDMYNRFNKLLAIKKEEERVNAGIKKPQMTNSLQVPFNYEVDIGPMRRSELSINSNSSTPRSLSESVQNRIIDRMFDNDESSNRYQTAQTNRYQTALRLSDLSGPMPTNTNMSSSAINRTLDSAESLIRRMDTRPGLPISQDILANSRAGLRPTVTRPASEAPSSNTSQRVQLINELNASLASRASRGSRRSSVRQLTPLEMSDVAPPGGLSPPQLPQRGRLPNLSNNEVRGLVGPNANIEQPTSGSGLRKKAKKKVTKSKQKSNYLM